MLSEKRKKELYNLATKAASNSYSPYSHMRVGASVLTKGGHTYLGTNVENVSFGLTICAERVALCNAISNGEKNIVAIAVYSEPADASPCGACRQFIAEFGRNIEVIYRHGEKLTSSKIRELLPGCFTKEDFDEH